MKYLLIALWLLAACEPEPTLLPFVTAPPTQMAVFVTQFDNATPTATRPPTEALTPSAISTPTALPSQTFTPSLVPTSILIASPTRGTPPAAGMVLPTWTAPAPDASGQIADHYVFGRPIPADKADWVSRTYPYGGTNNGRLQVHHGVDLVNPAGVAILAAADGVVVYAGDDLGVQFGSMNDYYGYLVVLAHDFTTPQGEPVFTLYGHMIAPTVSSGQQVREGDQIGIVGGTGVALGPHLHFEVRVGDPYSFEATRNPELWMRPFFGDGTLVGRVTDAAGEVLFGVTVTVDALDPDGISRETYTYGDGSVNPDPAFGENFTMGDLPANYYTVTVRDASGQQRFQRLIYVYPNRSTWIDVVLSR